MEGKTAFNLECISRRPDGMGVTGHRAGHGVLRLISGSFEAHKYGPGWAGTRNLSLVYFDLLYVNYAHYGDVQ